MIKCDSKDFKSSTSLVASLRMDTKENLKMWAKLLEVYVPTALRKEEYAEALASGILQSPQEWLSLLTRYELLLLKKLVKAGADNFVEEPDCIVVNTLEDIGLIAVDYCKDTEEVMRFMITDDLREAVTPHLDALLISEEQLSKNRLEQYAYGILNLYGLLSMNELLDKLIECMGDDYTEDQICWEILNSALVRRHTFEKGVGRSSEIYVQSPFLTDEEELVAVWKVRPWIKEVKHFSAETVFAAGNMPIPKPPVPVSDKLKQYMVTRLKYTEAATDFHLNMLWYSMQMDANPMSAINPIIDKRLSSMLELQEAIGLFMEYCNQCPRWFLRGYSSTEIHDKFGDKPIKTPPKIVAGPNMKAAGMDITPEMQEKFNRMFEEVVSGKKVGRNDPCPCGSGKKYKHCCGGN